MYSEIKKTMDKDDVYFHKKQQLLQLTNVS